MRSRDTADPRIQEEALIRAFVVARKRKRLFELLADPKRRSKATASLAHFKDLDPRYVVPLAPDQQTAAKIEAALRAGGAPDTCHIISQWRAFDGVWMPLGRALREIVGYGMGTLLSSVPGRLAYYEGEEPSDRCILARPW